MEVYIEYVIFDNLIIDYLIVYFTGLIASIKFKRLNMLLSVLCGVVSAVILPLFSIKTAYLIVVKILTGFLMVAFLKKYANFRQFLVVCIVLYSVTFLFGGVCVGVNAMLGISIDGGQVLINGFDFPISIFVLFASGYFYMLIKLIKYMKIKSKLTNFYFDVTIMQNRKSYYLRGFLDTGNKLFDNSSPVVIISIKTFTKIFRDYPLELIPLGNAPNNPHYLTTASVGDVNKILVLEIDKIYIKNNEKHKEYTNVKLGISRVNFSTDFDLLLHSSF